MAQICTERAVGVEKWARVMGVVARVWWVARALQWEKEVSVARVDALEKAWEREFARKVIALDPT